MNPSSFKARVLNAFHDLHASMTTSFLPPAAAAAFLTGAGTSVTALRLAVFLVIAFLGAMRVAVSVRVGSEEVLGGGKGGTSPRRP